MNRVWAVLVWLSTAAVAQDTPKNELTTQEQLFHRVKKLSTESKSLKSIEDYINHMSEKEAIRVLAKSDDELRKVLNIDDTNGPPPVEPPLIRPKPRRADGGI